MPTTDVHLRLSIWRPASLTRTYIYRTPDNVNPSGFSPLEQSDALEQIYTWNAGPHDVLGSVPPGLSSRLQAELLDQFSFEHDPKDRSIPRFYDAVTAILQDPLLHADTHWADSQEAVAIGADDDLNLRANIILAVLLHLDWIARTFRQVPQASVLIR